MQTRSISSLAVALVALAPAAAVAAGPSPHGPHDHHHRPAAYNDPSISVPSVPAALYEEPEYPLAEAFIPADPSNYTAGGLSNPQYVVVHTMQGYYGGSISWFQNPSANVSAHYCMRAEDGAITQMVRHADRAWHVGSSNPFALGIEHEGFVDDASWYTWETYLSSARLARWLCDAHDIPVDRDHVVGHVELPNQTHTDPGPNWDWDLYMTLIRDVVPQGQIHGVVVDRTAACTVTATVDTWVKATLEPSSDLSDDQLCLIPAGTSLTYLHASEDMLGHRRVTLNAGTPCNGTLATEGFVFADHFDGLCDPEAMAATGTEVILDDGGGSVAVAADGSFVLYGVAAGAHTIDVRGDAYLPGMAPVDVDVYPGARVVIAVSPVSGDPGGDTDGGSADGDGSGEGSAEGGSAEGDGGEGPLTTGGDPSGSEGDLGDAGGFDPALPPGFGEDNRGCSCRSQRFDVGAAAWTLPWLVLGWRRRRRA